MALLRVVVIPIVVFALAATPALVRGAQVTAHSGSLTAYAATLTGHPQDERAVAASNENEQNDNNQNSNNNGNDNGGNDNNDNNTNGNDNFSNDNNGNDNGGNDNNNNGNDNGANSSPSSRPIIVAPPAPVCSTPGQEMTFTSDDGRVLVKVFASSIQSVKISIRMPIDSGSVPPAPGTVVGGLLFQVIAESCSGSPIPTLSSEANLGVHYSDGDVGGLNESNFTLARLDTTANQWRQVQKQANDPPNNFVSATISDMGYYVLYAR